MLGQSAALSGPAAALGTQFRQGALLHFERLNAKGGVNGRQIELQSLDDGYEPDRCAENTQKLIEDGVFALFGYIGTPTSLAALPLATQAKTPFFAPFTGAEALRAPFNRYAFHVRASYFDETAEIVRQTTADRHQAHRRVLPERQLRQGRARRRDARAQATRAGARWPGHGRAQHGRRGRGGEGHPGRQARRHRADQRLQVAAPRSSAPRARPASAAPSTTCRSSAPRRWPTSWSTDARGVVVSQVMPFPFTPSSPLAGEYLAAGKAALGDKFEPNYSSMEGFVAASVPSPKASSAPAAAPTREALIGGLESLHDLQPRRLLRRLRRAASTSARSSST